MFTYMIEPPKDGVSYLTDPNHTQGVEQWTINWNAGTPTPTFVNSWDLPSTQPAGDQLGCFFAANYYDTVCIPQPSTASTAIYIDSVADRMQQFFHYTSNGGKGSVWTSAHDIQIVPSNTKLTQTEADIRILQRNTTVTEFGLHRRGLSDHRSRRLQRVCISAERGARQGWQPPRNSGSFGQRNQRASRPRQLDFQSRHSGHRVPGATSPVR